MLEKLDTGSGNSWLLVKTKVMNPGSKTLTIREQQIKLTVDNQPIVPDKAAIDAAEKQTTGKGFGDILGASIKAGASDTRISVFKVPSAGKVFVLALTEEKSTTAIAAPLTISTEAIAALNIPVAASTAPTVKPNNPSTAPTTKPTNPPPTPTAAPQNYGLNTLVSVKNWDMAVAKVERPGKELIWSEFGNKSVAAGTWLIVVFDMKNTGNTNFGVNTSDFELRGANNVRYKVSDDLATYAYSKHKGAQEIGGQVPPGVNVQYHILFDIAPDATGLQFVFKQDKSPVFNLDGSVGTASGAIPNAKPTTPPAPPASGSQTYGLNTLVQRCGRGYRVSGRGVAHGRST